VTAGDVTVTNRQSVQHAHALNSYNVRATCDDDNERVIMRVLSFITKGWETIPITAGRDGKR